MEQDKVQALLPEEERRFLDREGYLNLGCLLSDRELGEIRSRVAALVKKEGTEGGSELFEAEHVKHPREAGTDRLANLVNKGSVFDRLYTHPKLLAATRHVLGSKICLSSLNYRSARPGGGWQRLHVDWHEGLGEDEFQVCNSIWLLDDFSAANGATRVVPGSHLWGCIPEDELSDLAISHPEQVLVEGPAGTVYVFNAHVWHGGTANTTQSPRRAIHSYFCRRDQPQQTDQKKWLRQETVDRISREAYWLLNVS